MVRGYGQAVTPGYVGGITGRMHPGSASEGIHFKPRVVGEAVDAAAPVKGLRLEYRVFLQGHGSLGHIVRDTQVGRADHFEGRAQNLAGLAEFAFIAGSEYKFHTAKVFINLLYL